MTKQSVIVKVHFRIQRNQTIVFRKQERIDLEQRRVHLLVRCIERLHEPGCLRNQLRRKPQGKRQFARLKRAKADRRIDRLFENLLGSPGGDLFDVHAAGGRSHEHRPAAGPIEHDAEIEFFIDRQSFFY